MATSYTADGGSMEDAAGRWEVLQERYSPPTGTLVSAAAAPGSFWSSSLKPSRRGMAALWQLYKVTDIYAFWEWMASLPYEVMLERTPGGGKQKTRCPFSVDKIGDGVKAADGTLRVSVTWRATGLWEDSDLVETQFNWMTSFAGGHLPARDVVFSVLNPGEVIGLKDGVTGSWIQAVVPARTRGDHLLIDPGRGLMRRGVDWFPTNGEDCSEGLTVDPHGFRLHPNSKGVYVVSGTGYPDESVPKIRFRRVYAQSVS